MAQLSRPYQIGLAAVVLMAAVWLVLLQSHSSSPSTSASSGSAPTQTATSAPAKAVHAGDGGQSTGGSHIYTGPAPGVSGLTKAIARAHGAVATSERNASQLEQKSAEASSASPTTSTANATPAPAAAATKTSSAPATATKPRTPARTAPQPSSATPSLTLQHSVEAELARGKVVLILFWNPKGADDVAVKQAVNQLQADRGLDVAVQIASSAQVAQFGSITRGVQVYGTPTLLVVGKSGKVQTLTGLQDAYTIEQAIQETRHS